MDISLAPLDGLAQTLREAEGITTADVDPTKLRTPCVWVDFRGIVVDETLEVSGYDLQADLRLGVSDVDAKRNQVALAQLVTAVLGVVDVEAGGVIRPIGLVLPGSKRRLPGLSVPVTLRIEE